MVIKSLLIFLVIAILMEDSASIKKSEEEKKEEEEVAKAVNATLAEEEKKKKEEEDEKKRKEEKKKLEDPVVSEGSGGGFRGRDEALPSLNATCPVCPEVQDCPPPRECGPCAPCGPCPEERDCPEEKPCHENPCLPCRPCGPCPPVKPCPSLNQTSRTAFDGCPEASGLSVPVAMVVGALISLGTMGLAAVVGLILRYVPPLISGILFLTVIFVVWFLSSQYPDVARDMGGRVATILREATVALGHRIMAAIQRHRDQVNSSNLILFQVLSFKFFI
jgi:hypothetical protein